MFWSPYDLPTVLVKCTDVGENTVYNLFQLHEWPKRLYSRFQMDYFYIFSVKKCVRHIEYVVGSLFPPTELIIAHHSLAFSCEIQFCAENKHHIYVSIHNQRLFIFIDISISMFWSPYDHPTVLVKCTDVGKNTVYNLFQLHEWPKRLYSRFQMDYVYPFSVKKCVRHIVYVVGSLFLPTELIIAHCRLVFSGEISFYITYNHLE